MEAEAWEDWRIGKHTPPHLLLDNTWYMVSASAWCNLRWFEDSELALAMGLLIEGQYVRFGWNVELYVVMPDHYHAVARSRNGRDLPAICKGVHGRMSARMRNRLRQVRRINDITAIPKRFFNNYWDTCLNTEREYLNALEYVRTNPLRAGWSDPEAYPFRGPSRENGNKLPRS